MERGDGLLGEAVVVEGYSSSPAGTVCRQMDLSHAAQQTCSCLVVLVLRAEERYTRFTAMTNNFIFITHFVHSIWCI